MSIAKDRTLLLTKNALSCLLVLIGIAVMPLRAADVPIDSLSGQLPSLIKNNNGCYLITADISVTPGTTVTIEPGVVLLFKDFTGMQIHGTLLARGTDEQPIVFTSENDHRYAQLDSIDAAPYDWNGITLDGSGVGSTFEYCVIQFSLFGINALTEYVNLKACRFSQNGKSDLTINGVKVDATAQPFNYAYALPKSSLTSDAPAPAPTRRPAGPIRITVRTVSSLVLLAGLAGSALKAAEYIQARNELNDLNNPDDRNNLLNPSIQQDWDRARAANNRAATELAVSGGIAATGLLMVVFSFYF